MLVNEGNNFFYKRAILREESPKGKSYKGHS